MDFDVSPGATDSRRLHSLQFEFDCESTGILFVSCVFSCKMGKVKQTQEEFYFKIVKEFPSQLQTDKKILFCKICQIQINAAKKSQVTQHLQTANHRKRLADNPSSTQQLITNMVVSNENDESNEPQYANKSFNVELCDAFVSGS